MGRGAALGAGHGRVRAGRALARRGGRLDPHATGRGGAGVVIDGCIRDSGPASKLDIGIWVKGVTPNYHAQTNIFPFAINVPIACNRYSADLMITSTLWDKDDYTPSEPRYIKYNR